MKIIWQLLKEIPQWNRASQLALALAVLLLLIAVGTLATVPQLKTYAMISLIGLLLAIQAIVMWGNRRLVSPYTQAQRHFIAGDFQQVVGILKDYIKTEDHPIIDSFVLLGNAYRNLGQLHESEAVLRLALARRKDYHFALYGVGKIRLAKGDYAEAVRQFEAALENGASPSIRFDLAHALLRAGQETAALRLFAELPDDQANYRELFKRYVLHITENQPCPDYQLIQVGLPFWQAEVQRFAQTPYGQALQHDVQIIESWM